MTAPLPISMNGSPALSPLLSAQLISEISTERAVRMIATTPDLKAEAGAIIPVLERKALTPAGEDGVRAVVGRRQALYPPQDMGEGAMAAWWSDYIATLKHVPMAALEAGMQEWVRQPGSRFMPKPGELLELSMTAPNRAMKAYERAKAAMHWSPPIEYKTIPMGEAKLPDKTPEQKEAVRKMLEEFHRGISSKMPGHKPKPPPPSQAAVDETGISPALRRIINRDQ